MEQVFQSASYAIF